MDLSVKNIIQEFSDSLICEHSDNLQTILLQGGFGRNSKIIYGWSDVDIIIIWKDINRYDTIRKLTNQIKEIEGKYNIRFDVAQVTMQELVDPSLFLNNGMIINSIKRSHRDQVLYGTIPVTNFSDDQEKRCALAYIDQMRFWQRDYYIEELYGVPESILKQKFPKLIRRTFSILRASLRLFDVYCYPYEESIAKLQKIMPNIDTELLLRLIDIKYNYSNETISHNSLLVEQVIDFNENLICKTLKTYNYYG